MARQRRGRSRGPELKGTLGTLLRTAIGQAGAVREVLSRGAREGRAKLDEVRSSRRRDDALAELGELVLELIQRGEAPELEDHPEIATAIETILELDAGATADDGRGARRPVAGKDFVTPPRRAAFDRGGGGRGGRDAAAATDDDGGAVSSRSWRPPPAGADARVWRPPRDAATEPGARFQDKDRARAPSAAPAKGEVTIDRGAAPRPKGGIAFDDDPDADLGDYMHPDDVPEPDKK